MVSKDEGPSIEVDRVGDWYPPARGALLCFGEDWFVPSTVESREKLYASGEERFSIGRACGVGRWVGIGMRASPGTGGEVDTAAVAGVELSAVCAMGEYASDRRRAALCLARTAPRPASEGPLM